MGSDHTPWMIHAGIANFPVTMRHFVDKGNTKHA